MKINIKRLNERAKIPERGSAFAAGYDLFSETEDFIYPGETKRIGTGMAVEIPEGYFGGIFARSGLASKEGLRPANCVGVVDSDYRGEVVVALHNDSKIVSRITVGQKIAQLVVIPFLELEFEEVSELNNTDRGDGGFGSTGK